MEEGKGDNNSLSAAIVGRGDSTLDMTVCGRGEWSGVACSDSGCRVIRWRLPALCSAARSAWTPGGGIRLSRGPRRNEKRRLTGGPHKNNYFQN
jgi:hypothetical protein